MSSIKAVTARVLMILFWCITMPAMVEADDRAFAKFQEGLKLEEQLKVFEVRSKCVTDLRANRVVAFACTLVHHVADDVDVVDVVTGIAGHDVDAAVGGGVDRNETVSD